MIQNIIAITAVGLVSAAMAGEALEVRIIRAESNPQRAAPAENFTGKARLQSQFRNGAPSRVGGAIVTFQPGARTAWHTHPLGQTLIVTAGSGFVQRWGGARQDIRAGDVVWIPPGIKHWHGAAQSTEMTHVAISEALDGESVEWMEKVSDQQYRTERPCRPKTPPDVTADSDGNCQSGN